MLFYAEIYHIMPHLQRSNVKIQRIKALFLPCLQFPKTFVTSCLSMFYILSFCGKRGIRTPDTILLYTRFPGVPLQPLEHLSFVKCECKTNQFILIFNMKRQKKHHRRELKHMFFCNVKEIKYLC